MGQPLRHLLDALPTREDFGEAAGISITQVSADSRQVQPGALFVAYPGVEVDGHAFIPDALRRGAVAVVAEHPPPDPITPRPWAVVPSGREALAYLSAAWVGFPTRRLTVVGITGTDGKTTTCNLLHSILTAAGRRAGLISTVNAIIGDRVYDTGLHTTTPDAPDVQRYLTEMVDAGLEVVVLEATSHGLAQHRVAACDVDVAVVTNVTHEHLDIHGSLEAYQAAKTLLFRHLSAGIRKPGVPKVAVLNADDDSYRYLKPIPADRQISYSLRNAAAPSGAEERLTATCIRHTSDGAEILVNTAYASLELRTTLVGNYNVSNILAATAAALALDIPSTAIQAGVRAVRGIIGRMERIDEGQDFVALVDFAHTPNALENALRAARNMSQGRVIAVFGCAGERDQQKRPWMGEIAGRLADVTVITAEDPRRESLATIMAEIARGVERAGGREGTSFHRVSDRGRAIQKAVDLAHPGDLVIVLGKGHEQSMCFGTTEIPWSDPETLRAALRRRVAADA
jgi:UDP-N-acetylmuramoyl-L-alanyl-D-glutamate--2,6-diaminopimelate ligase